MGIKPEDVYVFEGHIPVAEAANQTIVGDLVPAGKVLQIDYASVVDETTGSKTVRLGYKRASNTFWVRQEPAATNYHGIEGLYGLILVENEQPIAMVESATASDVIRFYVRGRYI